MFDRLMQRYEPDAALAEEIDRDLPLTSRSFFLRRDKYRGPEIVGDRPDSEAMASLGDNLSEFVLTEGETEEESVRQDAMPRVRGGVAFPDALAALPASTTASAHPRVMATPPGHYLLQWMRLLVGRRTYEEVVVQTIADMRQEYFEALQDAAPWRARVAHWRGIVAVVRALGLDSLIRWIEQVRKSVVG